MSQYTVLLPYDYHHTIDIQSTLLLAYYALEIAYNAFE